MMTKAEASALELLGQAFLAFQELPEQHPADRREFTSAIHAAQNIVLSRVGYRALLELSRGQQQAKV